MMSHRLLLAALAIIASQHSDAFTPASLNPSSALRSSNTAISEKQSDVSIPYDAAARLAYDEWRADYGKGDFDESRYENFKQNYEYITITNVKTKKQARDAGEDTPKLFNLNEYGDYSSAEYEAAMAGADSSTPKESKTEGGVLDEAVESAQIQSQASNALSEAADALAEEEEILAKQLGLESVEELEAAIDALEGVDEEGIQENLAREARIRSAYLEWCKKYNKESDESRFEIFSQNFLAMEEYTNQSGKEMNMNEYADLSEEDYKTIMAGGSISAPVAEEVESVEEIVASAGSVAEDDDVADALKAASEAEAAIKAAKEETKPAAAKSETNAEVEARANAAKEARLEAAEKARAERAAAAEFAQLSEKEQREKNEKERKARQAEQEKAAEKLRLSNEAAAIAAEKERAKREAAQIARSIENDRKAGEIAVAKAREAEAKLLKNSQEFKQPSQSKQPGINFFSEFLGSTKKAAPKPAPRAAPKPAPKPAAVKKPAPKLTPKRLVAKKPTPKPAPKRLVAKKPTPKPAPVVAKKPTPKPAPVVAKQPATKPPPSKQSDSPDVFSFFSSSKPKASPKPISARKPAPAPAPAPKPSPAFSFFGSPSKSKSAPAPAPKVSKPVPAPKPFSFFDAKPAPKPKAAPVSKPAPSPKPFSFFSPKQAPKQAPAPAPAPKPSFGIFGKPAAETKEVKKSTPMKQPTRRFGTLSIPKPNAAKPTVKKSTPMKQPTRRFGTLSIPKPNAAKPTVKKSTPMKQPARRFGTLSIPKPEAKPEKKSAGFSFFGGNKPAEVDDGIPVLSGFTQNKDGSLTGIVRNAKGYRNGTKITTSPVRKGVKAGQVVKTSSGSQYRLE